MNILQRTSVAGADDKPVPLEVNPEGIPHYLKARRQWVLWRYELREGKWTKPPFQCNRRPAKSNDPKTWTDFESALHAYRSGWFDGLGFVFAEGDGLAGIDGDHVYEPRSRQWKRPDAESIVKKFKGLGYIEISPGGDGFRIFVLGQHPRCGKGETKFDRNWLEAYDHRSPRYLTVTGHPLKEYASNEPLQAQNELDWLYANYLERANKPASNDSTMAQSGQAVLPEDDYEVIRRARSAKGSYLFSSLYDNGEEFNPQTGSMEPGQDQSSMDAKLMVRLAFWCNRDAAQMERIFGCSKLGQRHKWLSRPDYRRMTIEKALEWNAENGGETLAKWDAEHKEGKTTDWIDEFNDRYSPVLYQTKMAVGFLVDDATHDREVWRFISFETFRQMHCAEYVQVGLDKNGNPIMKPKSEWLKSARRVKNRDLYFDPGRPPKLERDGYLNLWTGFAINCSSESGTAEPMLQHIERVICDGDPAKIRYTMGWLALLIQKPGFRHEVALILRGGKGSGKGTLGNLLCRIFGRHGLHLSVSRHLTGNFNDHLLDCCFLFSDEAFFAGDKAGEGVLKSRITEPYIAIEPKGLPVFATVNRLSVLMATNNDYVVPASKDERRYAVMDVSSCRIGDRAYFSALKEWSSNDHNISAFIEYLRQYDITSFEVRDFPETRELAEQRLYALPPFADWWLDALYRGSFGGGKWYPVVTTRFLFKSFSAYVSHRKFQKHDLGTDSTLGRLLSKHKLILSKTRGIKTPDCQIPSELYGDWHSASIQCILDQEETRPTCKVLGPLQEARDRFQEEFGLPDAVWEGAVEPDAVKPEEVSTIPLLDALPKHIRERRLNQTLGSPHA